jgi:hypothetical protein
VPPPADVEPAPVDRREAGPGVPVMPAPPVAVTVTQSNVQKVEQPTRYETRTTYVPVYVPVAVPAVRQAPPPPPVYWGFGGQLRPGSWQPAPDPAQTTPDKKPVTSPDPKKGGGAQ